jgi:hypothetical protein
MSATVASMFLLVTTASLRFQPSEKDDDAATVIDLTCSNNPLQKTGKTDERTNKLHYLESHLLVQ